MRTNFLYIDLSKLKKLEVQYLATKVIEIVEQNDPEALKIKEISDILVEQKNQIKLLIMGHESHPITPKLVVLRKQRNDICQGMIYDMKAMETGKKVGMQDALVVAKPKMLKHLQGLSRSSEKITTQTLVQFFDAIAEEEELQEAFTTMGMMATINNLKIVMNQISELHNQRRGKVTARPKMNTQEIVASLKSDLMDLFKQIDVAQIKHKEINYKPLIDELNNEILLAKAEVKLRASIKKRKPEEA